MEGVTFFDPNVKLAWEGEYQSLLSNINKRIMAGRNLSEILDFVFTQTREAMPCDRIGLSFLEEDGQRVVSHWARADYEPVLLAKGYSADMEGSTLAAVLAGRGPRVISNLVDYLESHPRSHSTALLVREGVRSSMTCPLTVDGREIGFLFRSSRREDAYQEKHVRLHQAMADLLSQAVEKAWRIEQLDAANKAYGEMLAFVSHELKNPLASIITQADLLKDGLYGELETKQAQAVTKIIGRAHFLLGLVKDYLDLARLEAREGGPRISRESLYSMLISPALEMLEPQLVEAGITIETSVPEGEIMLDMDPTLMMVVMNNLLGNAVKYGRPGGLIKLEVEERESSILVTVWNEGAGFPPHMKGQLFRKFGRLQTPELLSRKGTGVGLYTSWKIVKMHGGQLMADSQEGKWASFSFELPKESKN